MHFQPMNHLSTTAQSHMLVNVAVAVIHYKQRYLLGFRNSSQHQGDRYEFVGGKIEATESATIALIREVSEEIGIDINDNLAIKLGRLHYHYGDKQVCLHVYKVGLTAEQYAQHHSDKFGLEGQMLTWVDKADLLAGIYPLPAANQTILAWLSVPELLAITYPIVQFSEEQDAHKAWLHYHDQHLAQYAWVYIRPKDDAAEAIIEKLLTLRPDLHLIIPKSDIFKTQNILNEKGADQPIVGCHLTHKDLLNWYERVDNDPEHSDFLPKNQPLLASCHDVKSVQAANQLASVRLQFGLPPVIGIFLSPVLPTQTHPDAEPLGWDRWAAMALLADMPVIALGGLAPELNQLAALHGAVGVAGIKQFLK